MIDGIRLICPKCKGPCIVTPSGIVKCPLCNTFGGNFIKKVK